MCDLLLERINLIAAEKVLPADLSETVQTIVWAASRTQVDELKIVREQLGLRYGAQLAKLEKGEGRHVNAEVESRLVSTPPDEETKLAEFEGIAAEYDVSRCCSLGSADCLGWAGTPLPFPPPPLRQVPFNRKDIKSRIGLAPLPPDASALTAPIAPAPAAPAAAPAAAGGAASAGHGGDGKPPGGGSAMGPGIGIGLPVERELLCHSRSLLRRHPCSPRPPPLLQPRAAMRTSTCTRAA